MSEIFPSLHNLQTKLEIMILNHAEHNKFAIDLHYALGHDHPKIVKLQKELGDMVDKMNHIRKLIEKLSKEKSATG